jgi:thermitase
MKRFYQFLSYFLISLLLCMFAAGCSVSDRNNFSGSFENPEQVQPHKETPPYAENEVVARLKPGADPSFVASLVDGNMIEQFTIDSMDYVRIRIPAALSVTKAVEVLDTHNCTDYAEPNYFYKICLTPNDQAYTTRQYYHRNMNSEQAWAVTTGSSDVTIAIVDTGVDGTHPEFSGRMVGGYDFIRNISLSGSENSDFHGHGTHVAGIAAATGNNNIGIAGMDWQAKVMPVRVLDSSGAGSMTNIVLGIQFAITNEAKVINLSLGGAGYSQALKDVIVSAREAGVIVVSAMGNDYIKSLIYPAGFPEVIAVGSTDPKDRISDFSTRGEWISVTAPGSEIYSTFTGGTFRTINGTSMSTAQVTGLASLILSINPAITPSQVRTQLEDTADDSGIAGFDPVYGFGRINAANALGAVLPNRYGTAEVLVTLDGPSAGGINVILRDGSGNLIATGRSSQTGKAVFFDVPAGSYTVGAANSSEIVPITIIPDTRTTVTLSL